MKDIIWLQGHPAIAAIHYYQHLKNTHVFYCPDDITTNGNTPLTIRALARDILKVYDSNNKSLAVHFMHPCGEKRLDQVMILLNKMRGELRMACYELPTSKLQINLLLGWSMSIHYQHSETTEQWMRRCLVSYDPAASLAPSSCTIHQITDHTNLFCITDTPFIKQALFVNVTLSMCEQTSSTEHGMLLTADAKAAIQGWSDAMKSLSRAGTLILFVDEKLLYGQAIKNETNKSKQEGLLTKIRKATHDRLQELNAACPIYMYSRDYWSEHREELMDQIACMQHRHHLDISRSLCLHSSRQEVRKVENHPYLSRIQHVYLNETISKNRSMWKEDFSIMIQAEQTSNKGDTFSLKSPSLLDLPSGTIADYMVPLVEHLSDKDLTTAEHFAKRMTHSVSASDASTYQNWKSYMETTISATNPIENDIIMEEAVHNDKNTIAPLTPSKEPEHQDIQKSYDGDPMDLMELYSYAIKDDMIMKYIGNEGAYKRGGSILDSLDQTEFSGNEKQITLFAKAKGTADEPYNVHITLEKPGGGNVVISGGLCSCPVGKHGKCKHCVATLKMFMINGDEFDYAPNRQPPSTTKDTNTPSKDTTTPRDGTASKSTTTSNSTTTTEKPPNITPTPAPTPPASTNTAPSSSSRPPRRRRSLPWSNTVEEQPKTKSRRKANTEDDKKPKTTTTTKARQKKKNQDDDSTSVIAEAPKRTTTTRRKKKTAVDAMDDEFGIDTSAMMDMPTTTTTSSSRRKTPSRKAKLDKQDVDMTTSDTIEKEDVAPKKSVVDLMDAEFGLGMPPVAPAVDLTPESEPWNEPEPTRSLSPPRRSVLPSSSSPIRSTTPIIIFNKTPLKNNEADNDDDDDDDSDVTEDGLDLVMDDDASSPFQNQGSISNNSSNMSLDVPVTNTSSHMSLDIPNTNHSNKSSDKERDTIMIHSSSSSDDDDERGKVDDLFDEIGL